MPSVLVRYPMLWTSNYYNSTWIAILIITGQKLRHLVFLTQIDEVELAKKEIIEWLMKWLLELVGQALKD